MDFRLPNLGEGIDAATVTAVLVKPGDKVRVGQPVVSVDTDKASMEIETDTDGTIDQVLVKPGDKVPVGSAMLRMTNIEQANGDPKPASAESEKKESQKKEASKSEPSSKVPADDAQKPPTTAGERKVELTLQQLGEGIEGGTVREVVVKVGESVKAGQTVLSLDTDKAAVELSAESDGVVEAVHVKAGEKVAVGAALITFTASGSGEGMERGGAKSETPRSTQQTEQAAKPVRTPVPAPTSNGNSAGAKSLIPASPATRRLARELGVALAEVPGSGRGGRVTIDDLKGFIRSERQRGREGGVGAVGGTIVNAFTIPPLPDFSKYGPIEVVEFPTIRQTIAKNLTIGWRTMPMVTQHELADITELEAGRKRIVEATPKGAPKITMTVLAIKACVAALKEFPRFNSSYDMNAGKLITKGYFHIGIAVDTERGLVVPVIRDADRKSIRDLAVEVATLAEKARANKLALDEMRGGSFTITNLGGIGGSAFTPIVNYPEVAILGLSRSSLQPVVFDGQIVPRLMMPLSLTYDHRVIDGADGCRFTVRLGQLFSDPLRLLMET